MWREPEIVNFKITYEGSAISDNEIGARILADSLIGVSTAIEEANKLINDKNSEVFIKVKSNFRPGSFEVDLVQLLVSPGIQAAANLITILGFTGVGGYYGLIQVVKATKGGKIIKKLNTEGDYSETYFENCEKPMVLHNPVIQCYEDKSIQESIERALRPLEKDGYDAIGFSEGGNQPELITKEEYPIFSCNRSIDDEDILDEIISEGFFGIAQTNLEGHEKGWKLIRDQGSSFSVTISDQKFLNDVKNGKYTFCNGTTVRVKLRDITKRKTYVVHEYEVIEIIALYEPGQNIPKIIRKDQKQLFFP
jgi:hypothetical protein